MFRPSYGTKTMPRPKSRNAARENVQWKEHLQSPCYLHIAFVCSAIGLLWLQQDCPAPTDSLLTPRTQPFSVQSSTAIAASPTYSIDASKLHNECFQIPNIRPSGVFFADAQNKFKDLPSIEGIEPAFCIGTYFEGGNHHVSAGPTGARV